MSSRISQYSSEVDNESYAGFLSTRDTNYSPVIKSFELLFENVFNLFGHRLTQMETTYLIFFKIKASQ